MTNRTEKQQQCEFIDENGQRCTKQGMPCWLDDDPEDDPNCYACGEHAQPMGFCACCGSFWGGIESFDFGNGLCENCNAEFDDEDEDYDYLDYEPQLDDNPNNYDACDGTEGSG